MKRSTNIPYAEIQAFITEVLKENKQYYEKVQLRCVAVRYNGCWQNMLSIVRAFPKLLMPQSTKDQKIAYSDALLIEKWLGPNEIIPFLDEITKNAFVVDQESIEFGITTESWEKEQLPSGNDYLAYPSEQYQIRSSKQAYYSGDFLLSYNSPVYPNIYEAIRKWCQLDVFHGHADGRFGSIIVIMPQCKARIENLISSSDAVTVLVKIEDKSLQRLRVKGIWGYSGDVENFDHYANGSSVAIKRPDRETPDSIGFWLIGPDERIYDFHRETRYWIMGQTRVLQVSAESIEDADLAMKAIDMGEGPTVEFKPFIRIDNQKQEELIKAIIAFANTSGGVILIGVNNQCVVTGVEKEIAGKKESKTLDEAYNDYMGKLKQYISDALNARVNIELNKIVIEGHTIILMKVPEGNSKPYYDVHTNEVYVRRGANSVRPNPDYELPQLYSAKKSN